MKTIKKDLKKKIKILQEIIFMKCLECTNFQPNEIITCEIQGCPLWENRPKEKQGLYTIIKRMRQKKYYKTEASNY